MIFLTSPSPVPVVLTPMAKGMLAEDHPNYAGVVFHALSDMVGSWWVSGQQPREHRGIGRPEGFKVDAPAGAGVDEGEAAIGAAQQLERLKKECDAEHEAVVQAGGLFILGGAVLMACTAGTPGGKGPLIDQRAD